MAHEKAGQLFRNFKTSIHDFQEDISEARREQANDLSSLPKMPRLSQTRDIEVSLPATPTGSIF